MTRHGGIRGKDGVVSAWKCKWGLDLRGEIWDVCNDGNWDVYGIFLNCVSIRFGKQAL